MNLNFLNKIWEPVRLFLISDEQKIKELAKKELEQQSRPISFDWDASEKEYHPDDEKQKKIADAMKEILFDGWENGDPIPKEELEEIKQVMPPIVPSKAPPSPFVPVPPYKPGMKYEVFIQKNGENIPAPKVEPKAKAKAKAKKPAKRKTKSSKRKAK